MLCLGSIRAPETTMSKRLYRVYRAAGLALAAAALVACSTASAVKPLPLSQLTNDDQIFVQLREAARNNDAGRAAQLAAHDPELSGACRIWSTSRSSRSCSIRSGHARIDAPDAPVLSFLQKYDGQAIADRMRNDYLTVLGARHDWRNFDQQYARFVLNDDTQVKCYALESRASRGENVADAARALLVDPKWYGDGCVDLINSLAINQQFTFRRRLATDPPRLRAELHEHGRQARRRAQQPAARSGAVQSAPPTRRRCMLARGVGPDTQSHQLALLAITRMARNDPAMAAATFASVAPSLSSPERAIGWGTIAYQAAAKQMPSAVDWYRLSVNAPLSNPAYEWRTRTALLAGDWTMVRWSIEQMPAALRNQPSWVYWHARALKQAGDTTTANQEFESISQGYNFYGQLAVGRAGPEDHGSAENHGERRRSATGRQHAGFRSGAAFLRAESAARRQSRMELAAAHHERPATDRGRRIRAPNRTV